MRKVLAILVISLCCLPLLAKPNSENKGARTSVVQLIEEGSEGDITVEIDDYLVDILMNVPQSAPSKKPEKSKYHPGLNTVDGYRVLVFPGNSGTSAKSLAHARVNAAMSKCPSVRGHGYVYNKASNWLGAVGDFVEKKDAEAALNAIKRGLPQYAKEMRVISCKVRIRVGK